jgi:hypothetical protein
MNIRTTCFGQRSKCNDGDGTVVDHHARKIADEHAVVAKECSVRERPSRENVCMASANKLITHSQLHSSKSMSISDHDHDHHLTTHGNYSMMLSSVALRSLRRPAAASPIVRFLSDAGDGPRQRQVKVKRKDKRDRNAGGRTKELEVILAGLDAPTSKEDPAPDKEEVERRDRILQAYTVGRWQQHNALNHDLACKIQMKKHAVKMMPKDSKLKEEALKVDTQGPPRWRTIPAWTAPIPGFNAEEFMNAEE